MPGTHLLPPNLLKLFAPRPQLPYTRPLDRDINRVKKKNVGGVAEILQRLKDQQTDSMMAGEVNTEGLEEGEEAGFSLAEEVKRQIRREERRRQKEEAFKVAKETYKPVDDPEAVGDPYKTLFISRLNKTATESDLRREFESYGTIERVRIVRDKKGRSRGYAFIVYERERDMKTAYKESDGLHILGKRIMVDVERGRTVRGWKPRRLGGGLGGRPKPVTQAPAFVPPPARGGFRGGFRGGRGGFGGGDRGGFDRGDRGGRFGDDRGGGGGFRGGFGGGGREGGGFRGRDDFGGGGGGFRGGRGGGIGFGGGGGGGGFGGPPANGPPGPGGFGPPNGGGFGGGRGGFGGPGGPPEGRHGPPPGYGAGGGDANGFRGVKRDGPGGFEDRDPKRLRY